MRTPTPAPTRSLSPSRAAGVHTITLATPFPPATDPLVIDGTRSPVTRASPRGGHDDNGGQGIRIDAGQSTVRGLAINGSGPTRFQHQRRKPGGSLLHRNRRHGRLTASGHGINVQNAPDSTVGGTTRGRPQPDLRHERHGHHRDLRARHGHPGQPHRNGVRAGTAPDLGNVHRHHRVGQLRATSWSEARRRHGEPDLGQRRHRRRRRQRRLGRLIAGNLIGTDVTGTRRCATSSGSTPSISRARSRSAARSAAARNLISGNNVGMVLNNGVRRRDDPGQLHRHRRHRDAAVPQHVDGILVNTAHDRRPHRRHRLRAKATSSPSTPGRVTSGAHLEFGLRVTVRGNSIYSTTVGLGFDIDDTGVNPNDPGDARRRPQRQPELPDHLVGRHAPRARGRRARAISGVLHSTPSPSSRSTSTRNPACRPRPRIPRGQT